MKSIWENAKPVVVGGLILLSVATIHLGLTIAIRPELVEFIPSNPPLYLRVLAGIGGVASLAGALLYYWRAIAVKLIEREKVNRND